jgi:hypothetical protein
MIVYLSVVRSVMVKSGGGAAAAAEATADFIGNMILM